MFLTGYGECYCSGEECSGTLVISSFGANDLTGGDYPITDVVLKINGVEKVVAELNASTYSNSYEEDVSDCDLSYNVEVIATNIYGQVLSASDTLTMTTYLTANINATASTSYTDESCESTVNVVFEATDPSGGDYPIQSVEITKNGVPIEVTGSTGGASFIQTESFSSACGVTYEFQMTVSNSKKTIVATQSITTPLPPE